MTSQLSIFDQPKPGRVHAMDSQVAQVLAYLQRHGCITTMEAISHLGVTRLARCIADLEEDGWLIRHEPRVKVPSRSGKDVLVTRYHLIGRAGGAR